jgi:hypothetical protein
MKIRVCLIAYLVIRALAAAEPKLCCVRVQDDWENPVSSEVFLINPKNELERVGKTDAFGVCKLDKRGENGWKLRIKPISDNYYPNEKNECPLQGTNLIVRVTKKQTYAALKAKLIRDEQAGDFGSAAFVSQEIAARARCFDSTEASLYEGKTYTNLGTYLHVRNSVAYTSGGRAAMTSELSDSVSEFQRKQGLKVTGQCNYETLSKCGNTDVGNFLK